HYSDSKIVGFSHTHLSGTGIPDYNDVLLMPTSFAGQDLFKIGADGVPAYASQFSHADETARPGYYAVTLRDSDIRAELTTTLRAALHRYTFPRGRPARVVIDLRHRDQVLDSSLALSTYLEVWCDRQEEPRIAKIALSTVSIEGARKNLDAEVPGWDFDAVRRAADATWERELGKTRIDGCPPEQRAIFYTALYHAMLTPNVAMDVDGRYRGMDRQVHEAAGFTY